MLIFARIDNSNNININDKNNYNNDNNNNDDDNVNNNDFTVGTKMHLAMNSQLQFTDITNIR